MKELKYMVLADALRQKILSGEWPKNAKLMTETEMAEAFGVGRHTVREALNLLSTEGLVTRRQGSGTFVSAQSGPGKPLRLIGLISTFASYYIFPEILEVIEDGLRASGSRMLLGVTKNQFSLERSLLLDMLNRPIDGLIVECTCPQIPNPNLDLYRRLQEKGVPIVFLNAEYEGLEGGVSVRVDDEDAGRALAQRMAAQGARRFGGLFRTDYHGYRRFSGFYRACVDMGAEVDESLCKWFSDNEGKETLDSMLGAADIKRLEDLDALICYNDAAALNALEYLRGVGCARIPRMASFDNTRILKLSREPVTAITYPSRRVGQCAVEKLMNMIRGAAETSAVLPWDVEWQ